MGEELKQKIAESTNNIYKVYQEVLNALNTIPSSPVLEKFKQQVKSVIGYAEVHYMQASAIDLALCKQRHDPARMLSEVESRFNALEQGWYQQYPNGQFKADLSALFASTKADFAVLEDCLTAIS